MLIYNHRERGGNPLRVAHVSDIRPPSWEPPCTARSPVGAVYKCAPAPVRLWNTLGGGRQDGAKNFSRKLEKKYWHSRSGVLIYNHGERGATGGAGSPREPCKTPRTRTSPYRAQPHCAVYKWVAQQRDCGGVAGDGVGNPKSFICNGRGINPVPVILLFIANEICAPVLLYTFTLAQSMRKIYKTTAIFLPTFGYFTHWQIDLLLL